MLGVPDRREESLNEHELMNPSVSIVVNTLNRAEALRDLLNALAHQRYDNFEVVVVNGPSTDHTEAVIHEFGDLVKARTCPLANLSMSRNIGIQATAGEIVVFIDDDGVPEPFWLEELVVPYADPSVAGVGGVVHDHTGYDYQAKFICCDRLGRASYSLTQPFDDLCAPGTFHYPSLLGCNSSFRRSALVEVGGFDEEYDYYLDETDVCIRLVDAGYRLVQLDGAPVHHKFLPSDVRDQHKVVLNNRPIIKNAVYFSLVNAREHLSMEEILRGLAEFGDARRADLAHNLNVDAISEEQYWPALEVIEQAWAEGFAAGFRGRIALFAELPDKQREGFRPFPTIAQERPLRVVLVSQTLPPETPGGVGRYSLDLAQELAARGHDVRIITSSSTGFPTVDFETGVWVHRIPKTSSSTPPARLPHMPEAIGHNALAVADEVRRIDEIGPVDLVYAPLWDTEAIAVASFVSVPVVTAMMTTMGISLQTRTDWVESQEFMAAIGEPVLELERWQLRNSTALHALSSHILAEVTRTSGTTPPEKRAVIAHLGVSDLSLPSEDAIGENDHHPARPDTDAVRILFVGRFERRKGIDLLLQVMPRILAARPHTTMVFVGRDDIASDGPGTYRGRFEDEHSAAPWFERVHFRGEIDDAALASEYAAADIFVAPSRFESFGLIYLEAMRSSLPILALNEGAAPEVIGETGAAILVSASADELETALLSLIDSPTERANLGSIGRAQYERTFTTPAMADRVETLLRRTTSLHPGAVLPNGCIELLPGRGSSNPRTASSATGSQITCELPGTALYSFIFRSVPDQLGPEPLEGTQQVRIQAANIEHAVDIDLTLLEPDELVTVHLDEVATGLVTIQSPSQLDLLTIHRFEAADSR
ncbi:MAG TPA: hypothetical protein DEG43_17345 [Acidimicrobiaceae bacterium]|nr:hypothetical protein [Acidimicrobiaceae bacterium]